jgi:polyisoprenyl-phosphate glycosyltransferase
MTDKLVSIVVPAHNEEDNIAALILELERVLGARYEVVFVDDGSTDSTLDRLIGTAAKNKKIKYISFSRNFGHQAALRAGLAHASGDVIISMDADLQHPPSLIPVLLKHWEDGYEVVYTVRQDTGKESLFKRRSSSLFYKFINFISDLKMEEGAADFRLLDRKVVDVINAQTETDLFLRGYINWIGFKQIGIPYIPAERFSGTSKYTLKKMLKLAGSGVTQFSIKPLHLAFTFAGIAMLASFLYVLYALATLFLGQTVPGWLSLVVLIVFLQGIQFLLVGLVGEYLGRTFMQTKHRPEYIVSRTNLDKRI